MIEYWSPETTKARRQRKPLSRTMWALETIPVIWLVWVFFAIVTGSPPSATWMAFLTMATIIVAANGLRSIRRRHARTVLAYVEQAVRLHLPIPEMLEASAASEQPRIARRLNRLRRALIEGDTLADAMMVAVPHTPDRTIDLIAAAERRGNLPAVLRQLLGEQSRDDRRGMWRDFGLFRWYVVVTMTAFGVLMAVLQGFVIPRTQDIWFLMTRPEFQLSSTSFGHWISDYGQVFGLVVAVIGLILLLGMGGSALRELQSRSVPTAPRYRRLRDRIIWHLPVIGAMFRDHGLGDGFCGIAAALLVGQSLEVAMQESAYPYLNTVLRDRFHQWALRMAGGESVQAAASGAGMPAMIVGLCGNAARTGSLVQTFQFLSRHYRSKFERSAELIHAAAAPAWALVGGTLVLITWLSLFEPIIQIIEAARLGSRLW
ncbi:MAG: type II secretion system F family protein [Phycisphaerae bacterium]|nr:type II secretion system F family protein [Phycisphaerae bacterium]